jgi:ATP synthase protein I
VPDRPDEASRSNDRRDLVDAVAARESRKVRSRRGRDRTVWLGLGMFGVIGWSIAVPTLIGIAVGLWFDRLWPGRFSWTLALLLAGVTLGCFSAWYWVSDERAAIDEESRNID